MALLFLYYISWDIFRQVNVNDVELVSWKTWFYVWFTYICCKFSKLDWHKIKEMALYLIFNLFCFFPSFYIWKAILGMHTLMSNQQYYEALASSTIVNKQGLNSKWIFSHPVMCLFDFMLYFCQNNHLWSNYRLHVKE